MEWIVPWHRLEEDGAQVAGIESELQRELSVGQSLYGLPARAIGRRQDDDDVLFSIEDGSGRVAVVHLTWTRSPPD